MKINDRLSSFASTCLLLSVCYLSTARRDQDVTAEFRSDIMRALRAMNGSVEDCGKTEYSKWPSSSAYCDNQATEWNYLFEPLVAERGQFPSYAHIIFRYGSNRSYFYSCGGLLINDNVVLTAATCFSERYSYGTPDAARVRVGFTNSSERSEVQTSFVKGYCIFPDFKNEQSGDNLAVLILHDKFNRTAYVQPACVGHNGLASPPHNQKAACYLVYFYKQLDERLNSSLPLTYIGVRRFNNDKEKRRNATTRYKHGGNMTTLPKSRPCHGEFGSPVYCMDNCDGGWTQYAVGVYSFNEDCGQNNLLITDFYKIKTTFDSLIGYCLDFKMTR